MIDIVIVNWNSGEYLRKCIYSILDSDNREYVNKIFIIDNNSSDTSLDKMPADSNINFIINNENIGFSKACNQGFKLCTSSHVLLLNPDAQLLDTTLAECLDFLQANREIDILGCQLLDDKGNITCSCSKFPSPKGIFFDSTGLSKIAPFVFKPGIIMTNWDHKSSRYVDQLMGAFLFMRLSIFEKVGYFDERFFVYYEEVDFSKRFSEMGGKSFFNANIKAIHSGEGTTSSVKGFRLFLYLRSRLQYAKKHFNRGGYLVVWFCTFFIEPFTRTIILLLRGKFKEVTQVFYGYQLLIDRKA
ncbi:MAG: glycosyltransferase family 2 protein [Bacteroidota bacterium]|nr:glycosyltransferase family 2 protein [Bacteroidota bacterium]